MEDLKGRVALITGATGGIGRAILKSLAEEKIVLIMIGRRKETLEELKQEVSSKTEIDYFVGDVRVGKELENIVNQIKEKYTHLDILINGAGISSQYPFWEQPLEDIEQLIATNYFSYVYLSRLVVPIMKEQGRGHIINITSGSVMVEPPPRNFIVYTSLKVGLRAFSKGLFWEMRDFGIKVTSIFPGVTRTPLTGKLKDISPQRLMEPEVVAETVLFALNQPLNVCPLELAVINQQTPWKKPVIPFKQEHPDE